MLDAHSTPKIALTPKLELLLASKVLEQASFPVIYERGVAYEHKGYVKYLSLTPSTLRAQVAGTKVNYYDIFLEVQEIGSKSKYSLSFSPSSNCTCPFLKSHKGSKSLCKHMVAAAVAGRRFYAIALEQAALTHACSLTDLTPKRRIVPRI